MADITFNTNPGETIARGLLISYLNTGTSDAPVWSPVGKRVEESAMEMDYSIESFKDIFDETYSTAQKPTITQGFDPYRLDAADAAMMKVWNVAIKDQNVGGLTNMDMLIAHFYAGDAASPWAERYQSCAVLPGSFGGAGGGSLEMALEVTYGGTRTVGTIEKTDQGIVFTPEVTP